MVSVLSKIVRRWIKSSILTMPSYSHSIQMPSSDPLKCSNFLLSTGLLHHIHPIQLTVASIRLQSLAISCRDQLSRT